MDSRLKFSRVLLLFVLLTIPTFSQGQEFYYSKFSPADDNITLSGTSYIMSDGLLRLNTALPNASGHSFYSSPIRIKSSKTGKALSFSTVFAFAVVPQFEKIGGHGFAFTFAPNNTLPGGAPSQYLGLLNSSNNGNFSNHVFAVEFDEVQDLEFHDINDDHVGVNLNSMISRKSVAIQDSNLVLKSGKTIMAWIDYDSVIKQLNVSLSLSDKKPDKSLLTYDVDLSPYLEEFMYVGFSASTGIHRSLHYIKGWSFKVNGQATPLHLSSLSDPSFQKSKNTKFSWILGASLASVVLFFCILGLAAYLVWWYKNRDVIESWEFDVGPNRFSYQELKKATKGFNEKQVIGFGGFGKVYKGTLPNSNTVVAVKRVSHESKQGLQEFAAEISSIGRLRHRNLVQLLGWCRRRGDLILVYDFMPNGSLDKYLFDYPRVVLSWDKRFNIIKGVASGLHYLHEGWEQTVIHRDIKAANVLLDADLNGKLSDFGLARLYEHGANPNTTRVVGTLGYLAPELTQTGKPTTSSDVFAFGSLMLEVACGRRPFETKALPDKLILLDWVWDKWKDGAILDVMDQKLRGVYDEMEAMMVLKLGLMCSAELPEDRPTMKQVVRYLEGEADLPEMVATPSRYKDRKSGSSRRNKISQEVEGDLKSGSSCRNKSSEEIEDDLNSCSPASCIDIENGPGSLLSLATGNEGR